MIDPTLLQALNGHINAEMYSSYLYLSMAAYFDEDNLTGFSNWMKIQVQEEMMHAVKIYDFINDKGGKVVLTAIDKPDSHWDSPVAVIQALCDHEAKVTGLINDLMDLAIEKRDHATQVFLQWFITEQVEEEASGADLLDKVKRVVDHPQGLYMLDKELSTRTFTPPQSASGE